MNKQILLLLLSLAIPFFCSAQENDLPTNEESSTLQEVKIYLPAKTSYLKKLIFPAGLIGYGIFSVDNPHIKSLNSSWRSEIMEMHISRTRMDDYTQFAPIALVYSLHFSGIRGKNNIADITLISASSFLISTVIVRPLKQLTTVRRPDGSNDHSFPSGHTSTAFASAQFMYREYRDKDFLLSLVGYPFAIYTAVCRTVNDKHWLGDIVAGAGIGILSTELAYYMLPHIKNLFKSFSKRNTIVHPVYQAGAYGLGVNIKL